MNRWKSWMNDASSRYRPLKASDATRVPVPRAIQCDAGQPTSKMSTPNTSAATLCATTSVVVATIFPAM